MSYVDILEDRKYFPVHLKSIRLDKAPGIDLFIRNSSGNFVLYLAADFVFTKANQDEIKTVSTGRLYAKAEDHDKYLVSVEETLGHLIEAPELDDLEKSEVLYMSSIKVTQDMFRNPNYNNIMRTKKMASSMVDLIYNNDEASRRLLSVRTHDEYTYEHSVHVGILGISLVRELSGKDGGYDPYKMGFAFLMHDIGKVKVPAEIINKPAKLTDEEWKRMRIHPYQGYKMLQEKDLLTEECSQIVYCHHERQDGKGYPRGLKGDEIPYYGRIGVIADVFDALTARRSYKPAMSAFEALKVMKEQMPSFFDREMFAKFTLLFADSRVDTDEVLRNVLYH